MATFLGNELDNLLIGGPEADALLGLGGNDTLQGGGADDFLQGGQGDDTLDGGADQVGANNPPGYVPGDSASYTDAQSGLTIDLGLIGPQSVGGGLGTDTLIDIEILDGGSYGDILRGNPVGGALAGFGGNDTLEGRGGPDVLWAGTGDDVLDGGAGTDWVSYSDGTAVGGVVVSLAVQGVQAVGGGLGADSLINFENLWGTRFADSLTGDAQANFLMGAAGDDTLAGGAGDDWLMGGDNDDQIHGGQGFDAAFFSGAQTDYGLEFRANGTVIVTDLRENAPEGVDILRSVEAAYFIGDESLVVLPAAFGPGAGAYGHLLNLLSRDNLPANARSAIEDVLVRIADHWSSDQLLSFG